MRRAARLCTCLSLALFGAACSAPQSFESAKLSPDDPGKTMSVPGLLSKPDGDGPFPAVVLLPTCHGLLPHVTQTWPKFLNGLGYVTLVVDSLRARGMDKCTLELVKDHESLARDAYGGLEHLAALPYVDRARIGVMGFSMGGVTVNYLVAEAHGAPGGLNFAAAASLYAGCITVGPNGPRPMHFTSTTMPLAKIVGEKDARVVRTCTRHPRHPRFELYVLEDAYHAFDIQKHAALNYDPAGNPSQYSARATEQAREITKDFFARYL